MKTFLQLSSALVLLTWFASACGVKKPPTPAYTLPAQNDPLASPTPTPKPGFSNPSGPLESPSQ